MTRRVVITGLGIISSIGNNADDTLKSLQQASSGIKTSKMAIDNSLRSQVAGNLSLSDQEPLPRKYSRFMGNLALYSHYAMEQAVKDAGLSDDLISNERTGLVVGSGGIPYMSVIELMQNLKQKGLKRVGPCIVPQTMTSTNAANLATNFKIKGLSYSIGSACATSSHCIGNAYELIQFGKQDLMFAGGSDDNDLIWHTAFDAMGALSTSYNETPARASRPFDKGNDGFVISGGAGILVLEEIEHAKKRGAHIYAELTGYGATSDGHGMVQPSGIGAERCMKQALGQSSKLDYINAHGTSTPIGDAKELHAIESILGSTNLPYLSSTKSLTGHSLGAAGVNEAIFTLLMMEHGFISPSINIEQPIEEAKNHNIVTETITYPINRALSNSFGFGGANASLVFEKV